MKERSRTPEGRSRSARRILFYGAAAVSCLTALGGRGIGGRDAAPADVVIHEVCWTGTKASSADEWIELRSNVDCAVSLSGWRLAAEDGVPSVTLSGTLDANGFFLLERTDDSTVADVAADVFFTGTLENSGEALYLFDSAGRLVDSAECGGGWFAGESAPSYATMERVNPRRPGVAANWRTHDGSMQNGHDTAGHALRGTPRAANSVTKPPHADFAASLVNPTVWDNVEFWDLSTDGDGEIVSRRWDFGDGTASDTQHAVHRFRAPGTYCVAPDRSGQRRPRRASRTVDRRVDRGGRPERRRTDRRDRRSSLSRARAREGRRRYGAGRRRRGPRRGCRPRRRSEARGVRSRSVAGRRQRPAHRSNAPFPSSRWNAHVKRALVSR